MVIIAERVNASRKHIAQAISSKNVSFIQSEAKAQAIAGADYIDVNVVSSLDNETERFRWVIEVIQDVVDLPLCIESMNPEVIRVILPMLKKTPMISFITLSPSFLNKILPLVAEYKTKLIVFCQINDSITATVEEKIRVAEKLVETVEAAGISPNDLYIDPLIYPLANNYKSGLITLGAIEQIMKQFPGVHTTCALANISRGLPARELINYTFLAAAILKGLDSAVMDPTNEMLRSVLKAALTIAGQDEFCMNYIKGFKEGQYE